MYKEDDVLVIV